MCNEVRMACGTKRLLQHSGELSQINAPTLRELSDKAAKLTL